MILSNLTIKYAKLAISNIRSVSNNSLKFNCDQCGDKKGRGSITAVDDEDGVRSCFNAGCIFCSGDGGSIPFAKSLQYYPGLENQYKTERFKNNIDALKGDNSLNNILNKITGKEVSEDVNVIEDVDSIKFDTGLDLTVDVPEIDPEIEINFEVSTGLDFGLGKPAIIETGIKLPPLFQPVLIPILDVPEACSYLRDRLIEPQKNWYFSRDRFVEILGKHYFIEDYIFIPLFQGGKIRGFYTRSIYEKQFSTIILPGGEKYWCCDNFDPDKPAYIFEGIFDAISSGLDNVVSSMSADLPSEFLDELKEPIFCLDLDITGVNKSIKYSQAGHKVFVWPENLRIYKDMNEALKAGEKMLEEQIKRNVFSGIQAQILLPMSLV